MSVEEEILQELKTLNAKMDQLITAVNRSRTTNMPAVPTPPQMPNMGIPGMGAMGGGTMPMPNMNFPQVPNAEDIKKQVEERIQKARAEAEARMAEVQQQIED